MADTAADQIMSQAMDMLRQTRVILARADPLERVPDREWQIHRDAVAKAGHRAAEALVSWIEACQSTDSNGVMQHALRAVALFGELKEQSGKLHVVQAYAERRMHRASLSPAPPPASLPALARPTAQAPISRAPPLSLTLGDGNALDSQHAAPLHSPRITEIIAGDGAARARGILRTPSPREAFFGRPTIAPTARVVVTPTRQLVPPDERSHRPRSFSATSAAVRTPGGREYGARQRRASGNEPAEEGDRTSGLALEARFRADGRPRDFREFQCFDSSPESGPVSDDSRPGTPASGPTGGLAVSHKWLNSLSTSGPSRRRLSGASDISMMSSRSGHAQPRPRSRLGMLEDPPVVQQMPEVGQGSGPDVHSIPTDDEATLSRRFSFASLQPPVKLRDDVQRAESEWKSNPVSLADSSSPTGRGRGFCHRH